MLFELQKCGIFVLEAYYILYICIQTCLVDKNNRYMMNLKILMLAGMMYSTSSYAQTCCGGVSEKKCNKEVNESCCIMDNDVVKTILSRRSIRKYLDIPVEHEKLELIAKCGINAPNGMNKQPWAVRVVESKNFIEETTKIFKQENPEQVKRDANFKNMYRNAPNIIVVATPKGNGLVDAGLMGENMMLAAKSLGLGTCCLGGPVRFLQSSKACQPYIKKLNLPEGYEICYIIAVGYPDETPEAKHRDINKIEFIK